MDTERYNRFTYFLRQALREMADDQRDIADDLEEGHDVDKFLVPVIDQLWSVLKKHPEALRELYEYYGEPKAWK